jgi:hypothetical protein
MGATATSGQYFLILRPRFENFFVIQSTGSQNWSELKRKKRFGVTMLLFFSTTTASGHGPLIEAFTDFLRRRNVSLKYSRLGYRYGTGTFIKEIQPKVYGG